MRFRNPIKRKKPSMVVRSHEELAAIYRNSAEEWLEFRGKGNGPEILHAKAKQIAYRIVCLGAGLGNEFNVRSRKMHEELGFDVERVCVRCDLIFFQMHLVHRCAAKLWPPERVEAFMRELVAVVATATAQIVNGAAAQEAACGVFAEGFRSYSAHFWEFREGVSGAPHGEMYWESAKRLAKGLGHEWNSEWLFTIEKRLHEVTLLLAVEPLLEPDKWQG